MVPFIFACEFYLFSKTYPKFEILKLYYKVLLIWNQVGWIYGSTAEDVLTGLSIDIRGWGSVYCTPDPPAFLGCAPIGGPASLTQQKRWATGLLEILISKNCPIIHTIFANLQFRECLAYLYILFWGFRSIPELCHASILPAYCLITNSNFLPKVSTALCFYFYGNRRIQIIII